MSCTETHPLVSLVRRFCCDYLSPPDLSVIPEIFHPAYRLHVGGLVISGREAYRAVATPLFAANPDFGITVHEIFTDGSSVAVRFSSHATSLKHDAHRAVWGGVILFASNGDQFTGAWLEEDFLGRSHQLASGVPDPLEGAHPDPWTIAAMPSDTAAEEAFRDWTTSGGLAGIDVMDASGAGSRRDRSEVDVRHLTIDALCAVDGSVAFHVSQSGHYLGGLTGYESMIGHQVDRHIAGIATVRSGQVAAVRSFSDRYELARRLRTIGDSHTTPDGS